ncbi:MAG TPA: ATP-binding protein [Vicinamibacterales bacterium]|nr:ATP-binding protein [Vicinamibacterales bacterium]
MPSLLKSSTAVCLSLTRAIGKTRTLDEIYAAALDALTYGLGVERSSILLFDADGVMRFKAVRGISDDYRRAVEGHTPWTPEAVDPEPIVVRDVTADVSLAAYLPTILAEHIAAMAFIPLVSQDRVIGKFMLYFDAPHAPDVDDLQLAAVIAAQVAFAVERTKAEDQARRSEARLRFALDAASMGTWDWDLRTNEVQWSDNLQRIHGLPEGVFDGTFASYEREIHPEDREKVFASVQRALSEGVPHDVEYRIVAPDGTVRWCEGKGRVEYADGQPVAMSGICMMVTRRKEAELARLAAAEEASRLKDEFLATLSHELRTPLNAILGWTELLRSGEMPAERIHHAIDVISRNARLQAQLIEDILDVSRIITGKLELDRRNVPVAQLVETAIAAVQPPADARRITFDTRLSTSVPFVEGDPKRLHQVLNNVLANAVKFSHERGRITIRSETDDQRIAIRVRDEGAGIAPEFLPHIFERFRQADSRSTRKYGGLGLGLAIARHLVELHGGSIQAESAGLGHGATVTVSLPLVASSMQTSIVAPAAAGTDVRLDGLRALVVDDQRDSCELVAMLLERHGAAVVACDSAVHALARLQSGRFDLLIADIAMPEIDGYGLIRDVRARGFTLPAIAFTAYARPDDRRQAFAAGYSAYCAKPIDGTALLQTIRKLVAPS